MKMIMLYEIPTYFGLGIFFILSYYLGYEGKTKSEVMYAGGYFWLPLFMAMLLWPLAIIASIVGKENGLGLRFREWREDRKKWSAQRYRR